jgi:hypothetical protein
VAWPRGSTHLRILDVVVDVLVRHRTDVAVRQLGDPLALPAADLVRGTLLDGAGGHHDSVAAGRPPRRVRRPAPGDDAVVFWTVVAPPALDLCGARTRQGRRRSEVGGGERRKKAGSRLKKVPHGAFFLKRGQRSGERNRGPLRGERGPGKNKIGRRILRVRLCGCLLVDDGMVRL